MLGLPSTTEVSVRLPKEAFYRNLKLDAKMREQFVSSVESITVVNTIKPATANIADGKKVHEILVVAVEPRGEAVPEAVIRAIVGANHNKVLLVDLVSSVVSLVYDDDLYRSELAVVELLGRTLDEVWESILAQVIFGDRDGHRVEDRISHKKRAEVLEAEIERLEVRARKERQLRKKNVLILELGAVRDALNQLLASNNF